MTQKWTHLYELKPGRWVFVPTVDARKTGRRIKREVTARWTPPDFYFHLRAGGHVAAIRCHESRKYFFRADLEDFFGQVNRSRVTRCLKEWFPYAAAREMASESVVRRPALPGFVLPYGFIQSPILASLALDRSKLGSYLRTLDAKSQFNVSVYVDDIIISCDDEEALTTAALAFDANSLAAGFPVSSSKREGPGLRITAFNIELSHMATWITGGRMAKFRAAYKAASTSHCQAGILTYVDSVNPAQSGSL